MTNKCIDCAHFVPAGHASNFLMSVSWPATCRASDLVGDGSRVKCKDYRLGDCGHEGRFFEAKEAKCPSNA